MSAFDPAAINRVVEVVLPRGGLIMGVVEGYFDESGDLDTGPRVFSVSGYFIHTEEAVAMNAAWLSVLEEYGLPYFHMVECAGGSGIFKGMSSDQRTELVKRLIALIKRHTLEGFSSICIGDDFQPSERFPDVYSMGVQTCVMAVRSFIDISRLGMDTAYFFEAGHKASGRAYNLIAAALGQEGSPLTFAGKTQAPILQAADLLAWQTTKYVKDRKSGARPPRKDFESLMEHGHTFAYSQFAPDGESTMGFEFWPLSRRTKSTESFTADYSGPIHFLRLGDDPRPIIGVQRTLGWAPAPAHMMLVGVQNLGGGTEFSLLLDHARTVELVAVLLDSLGAHAGPEAMAVIAPEAVTAQVIDGAPVLSIGLPNGGRFGLKLSDTQARSLLEQLGGLVARDA